MRSSLGALTAVFVFATWIPVCHAQSTLSAIQGRVVDEAARDLPGVKVVVSSLAMQGSRGSVTAANGSFRFSLLPPGVYRAVCTLNGFQQVEQDSIRVPMEGVVTLEVTMQPAFGDEVIVTSASPLIGLSLWKISCPRLKRIPPT